MTDTPDGPRWAQTVAAHGAGPTRTIDIDIHLPGTDEPVAVEIPRADAEVLHAMLGDALADDAPEQPDPLLRAIEDAVYEYRERTMIWGDTDGVTEAIARAAWREVQPELDQLRAEVERLRAAVQRARDAAHIADAEDITDWQRGYRACADRFTAALDGPTTADKPAPISPRTILGAWSDRPAAEQQRCCVCGSPAVTYRNYRDQPFCQHCADPCDDGRPCAGTGCTHEQAHADLVQLTEEHGLYPDQQDTTEGDQR